MDAVLLLDTGSVVVDETLAGFVIVLGADGVTVTTSVTVALPG